MNSPIDLNKAKEILGQFTAQAEQLLGDPAGLEAILQKLEEKLEEVPTVGNALSRLPLCISLIRSYITKEYTVISPKVIVSLVCAVLYLLKGRDLIDDSVPVLGYADDIAVFGAALLLIEPELNAYAQWREETKPVI